MIRCRNQVAARGKCRELIIGAVGRGAFWPVLLLTLGILYAWSKLSPHVSETTTETIGANPIAIESGAGMDQLHRHETGVYSGGGIHHGQPCEQRRIAMRTKFSTR